MYSIIQEAIKEYILEYYTKYEQSGYKIVYEEKHPYISYGSRLLYTMESSLVINKCAPIVVQNILRAWGLDITCVHIFYEKIIYHIKGSNNEIIVVTLSSKYWVKCYEIFAINDDLILCNSIGSSKIRGMLLTLLVEPVLFFEVFEGKITSPIAPFIHAYKNAIYETTHNYSHKYMIVKQLVTSKRYIVNDILYIVMDMYAKIIVCDMREKLIF